MENNILSVYASYADCYSDYENNYLSPIVFTDDMEINKAEFMDLCFVKEGMPVDMPICALDFYYNRFINERNIFAENLD